MRVLLISDEPSPYLWDHFKPENVEGLELILSAGDLKTEYLEFLSTMIPVPLVYVLGNHDKRLLKDPPGGCTLVDGLCVIERGVKIAGLSGCMGANPAEPLQFTEAEMAKRLKKLEREVERAGGIDIFLTHAPSLGRGDGDDPFHRGFDCFNDFLLRWQPRLHVFGHQHRRYNARQAPPGNVGRTMLVNACGYRIISFLF